MIRRSSRTEKYLPMPLGAERFLPLREIRGLTLRR